MSEAGERWEGRSAPELAARWSLPAVHLFARVGSTNDVARALAAEGAPAGTLVLAEEQRAGRGRAGRSWSSPPGLGLWGSLIARPAPCDSPEALPQLAGLAVARALDSWTPHPVLVKWPNDLVLGGRKLGGILCEAQWAGGSLGSVVVGLGLNIQHRDADFPEELRPLATSLLIAAAARVDRLAVADAVIGALRALLAGALRLTPARLEELDRRDALRGQTVRVSDPSTGVEIARGDAAGFAADGALRVRTPGGLVRRVRSGTVRPLRSDGSDGNSST